MFTIKLHLGSTSISGLGEEEKKKVGMMIGIKGFPLKYKRISRKLNDIFYWIHWEGLIICQVLGLFCFVFIAYWMFHYVFERYTISGLFLFASWKNILEISHMKMLGYLWNSHFEVMTVGLRLCHFSCLSKTCERTWIYTSFLVLL